MNSPASKHSAELSGLLSQLEDGREENSQRQAAAALRELVATQQRLLPAEALARFLRDVFSGLAELVAPRGDPGRARGGVLAVLELVKVPLEEAEAKIIRLANLVRLILQQPSGGSVDVYTLVLAAKALGALAKEGGPQTADFVEFEARRALEWLQAAAQRDMESSDGAQSMTRWSRGRRRGRRKRPRQFVVVDEKLAQRRKLAAVLVLKELAENCPTLLFSHVSTVLDHIGTGLHDKKEFTRNSSMLTLRAFLLLILQRESRLCVPWYYKIFELARAGFNKGKPETIHGSLGILGEMLRNTKKFMIPRYTEVCETVLRYREHLDPLVKRTVIGLFPELAVFLTDAFVRRYLDSCIKHLFSVLDLGTEVAPALDALGSLAAAVSFHILPFLPEIVIRVRSGLAPLRGSLTHQSSKLSGHSSKYNPYTSAGAALGFSGTYAVLRSSQRQYEASLRCISMLAQAVNKSLLQHHMADGLLEEMFQNGLSAPLIDSVSCLRRFIPSLAERVMAHLLHSLSKALADEPFHAPEGGGILNPGGYSHLDMLEVLEEVENPSRRSKTLTSAFQSHRRRKNALVESLIGRDYELDEVDINEVELHHSPHAACFFSAPSLRDDFADSNRRTSQELNARRIVQTKSHSSNRGVHHGSRTRRDLVILALRTLREFEFEKINLLPFVYRKVLPYLDDSDLTIRMEAALTSGALLLQKNTLNPEEGTLLLNWNTASKMISRGVRRLLTLGVSDSDPSIRFEILSCLRDNPQYDLYLVQDKALHSVFVALQDEVFYVKRVALEIVSRLSPRNPAHVHPAIRKCINGAMAQLEFSPTQTHREEAAVVLLGDIVAGFNALHDTSRGTAFMQASPLLSPNVASLLRILMVKLPEATSSMSTAILRTLGEVASMDGIKMDEYMPSLFPILINFLQDQGSLEKRRWALWTLGRVVSATGQVMTPLVEHPYLLESLLSILKSGGSTPWELREEALKTLGILGALDPFERQRKLHERRKARKAQSSRGLLPPTAPVPDTDSNTSSTNSAHGPSFTSARRSSPGERLDRTPDEEAERISPRDEEYYPTVAIDALVKILEDPTLSTHHSMVVQALTQIFRSLGLNCVSFLPVVMPYILDAAKRCEHELRKVLFHNISVVVSISKQHIRPFLGEILGLAQNFWYENLDQVFVLIEDIAHALREEFVPFTKLVVPNLLSVLSILRGEAMDSSAVIVQATISSSAATQDSATEMLLSTSRRLNPISTPQDSSVSTFGTSFASNGSSLPFLGRTSSGTRDLITGMPTAGDEPRSKWNLRPRGVKPFTVKDKTLSQLQAAPIAISQEQMVSFSKYSTPTSARRVFKTIESLGFILSDYFYLVIPALIDIVESKSPPNEVRLYAMHTLGNLSNQTFFSEYALHAMQCLLRILRKRVDIELTCQALDTLCILALHFPSVFSMFQHTVRDAVRTQSIPSFAIDHLKTTLDLLQRQESGDEDAKLKHNREKHLDFLLKAFYGQASRNPMFPPGEISAGLRQSDPGLADLDVGGSQKLLDVNQGKLKRAWAATSRSTSEEWKEWMRRLSVEFMRESPSPSLRACSALAQIYDILAKELFNAAFVSCWSSLSESAQQNLIDNMQVALGAASTPPDTLQTLLDLAEFMEHDDRVLPIGIRDLGEYARKCHAYAKALHYQEIVFRKIPGACTEGLISINNKLEQAEAAVGILHYVQQLQRRQMQLRRVPKADAELPEINMLDFGVAAASLSSQLAPQHQSILAVQTGNLQDSTQFSGDAVAGAELGGLSEEGTIKLEESWFEKLGRWEEALASYDRELAGSPSTRLMLSEADLRLIMGKARCLSNLGEYDQVMSLANEVWPRVERIEDLRKIAPVFCESAWARREWQAMDTFADYIPEDDVTGCILKSVLALQRNSFNKAREMIDRGRVLLGEQLGALVGESYNRAYRQIVTVQQFAELDEVFEFKSQVALGRWSVEEERERKAKLQAIWAKRVRGCQENVSVWQSILAAHNLILGEKDDLHTYIKFSTICRKSGRLRICLAALQRLGVTGDDFDDFHTVDPNVSFAFLKYRWAALKQSNTHLQQEFHFRQSHFRNDSFGPGMSYRSTFTVVPVDHPHSSFLRHRYDLSSPGGLRNDSLKMRAIESKTVLVKHLEQVIDEIREENPEGPSKYAHKLLVRCYLKLGAWRYAIEDYKVNEGMIEASLQVYKAATELENGNYKAWHALALMNFRAVDYFSRKLASFNAKHDEIAEEERRGSHPETIEEGEEEPNDENEDKEDGLSEKEGEDGDDDNESVVEVSEEDLRIREIREKNRERTRRARELQEERQRLENNMKAYVVPAIRGFFRSVALGQGGDARNVLQDILRLLTLWFDHGTRREVADEISLGFESVNIGTWLDVVPQLIARIHTQASSIRDKLNELLLNLGREHPHALVYPLTVAAKSINPLREAAANAILAQLKGDEQHLELVMQAELVSKELIRVAILLHEQWYEVLEDASREYFNEKNFEGMLRLLEPLHKELPQGHGTGHEKEFYRKFGRELEEAHRSVERYKETKQELDINHAWELYYHVFRKIHKDLQGMKQLELHEVSPALLNARNLDLAVPGTYVAGKPVVRIENFSPSIRVIISKQRPRQITIEGSDGRDYLFLLKGHEDLRQDERVMQLFGLVNRLLSKERETNRHDLSIERFAVIPLSHNVGISEWLPNTDTFHALIERFRGSRNVLLDIEQRLISKAAPDYNTLTMMQKVEAFCHALSHTNGEDLGKVLWLKSRNSEIWLDRRTNYTRSLATMSMVGYILGLGDRHPSNLMLDRASGKVVHIDFGDCFEVAMHREKFPEKVPFRLTRMLIAAMEVSGVEGNFRYTAESVMRVLRANRDSVMAMLEAFVHDPLINWRLLTTKKEISKGEPREADFTSPAAVDEAQTANHVQQEGDRSRQRQRQRHESFNAVTFEQRLREEHSASNSLRPRAFTEGIVKDGEGSMITSATPSRRTQMQNTMAQMHAEGNLEELNQRAIKVLQRVHDKLTGMDFAFKKEPENEDEKDNSETYEKDQRDNEEKKMLEMPAPVSLQVHRLIVQATSHENLSQAYFGWCSVW